MGNHSRKEKLRDLGKTMMGASWGFCALLGVGGTTATSILSGFISSATKQLSLNFNYPLLFAWFLIKYGLMATVAIAAITLVFKGFLYIVGAFLMWLGESFSIPRIAIAVRNSEVDKLFRVIERKLDQRTKVLKKAGLQVKKNVSKDGHYFYRFLYADQLIYHFSMIPRIEFGHSSFGFYDGWTEPLPNAYTAFGTIHANLGTPKPKITLKANLSLIVNSQGIPVDVGEISYDELAELIWEKVSGVIESRMNQIPLEVRRNDQLENTVVPDAKSIVYKIGLILDIFEKKFDLVA